MNELQDVFVTNFPDKIYSVTEFQGLLNTPFNQYGLTDALLLIIAFLLVFTIFLKLFGR